MRKIRIAGILAATLFSLIIILQNTQQVEVRFLLFRATMPNAFLMGINLLMGAAAGILLALLTSRKR